MTRPDFEPPAFLSPDQKAAMIGHARKQWLVVLADGRRFFFKEESAARAFSNIGDQLFAPVA